MALYRSIASLQPVAVENWASIIKAGAEAPLAGIYRCRNCKLEVVVRAHDPLPGGDHGHYLAGPIEWELFVAAETERPDFDALGCDEADPTAP